MNNIRRLMRDRFSLVVMLVLPVIFISFSMFALNPSTPLNVAIIDKDKTQFTAMLREGLEGSTNIEEVAEDRVKQRLIAGKLDYVIFIEEGFTRELIQGKETRLKTMSLKETNTSVPVKMFIDSFINASKNIASAAKGSEEAFYKGLELYRSNAVSAVYKSIENTEWDTLVKTRVSFGYLVMFMFFMSNSAASLALEDKQMKTYGRVLCTPISARSYFLQNILSSIAITAIQVCAIFAVLLFIFKANMGNRVFSLLVLFIVFSLTSVSLGMAISSMSKDLRQNNAMSYLIIIPLCMLGGCFWDIEIAPEILQRLSNFTPVTWVLRASEELLLYGGTLSDVIPEIIVLLLFSLVFTLIGSNKDILKKA